MGELTAPHFLAIASHVSGTPSAGKDEHDETRDGHRDDGDDERDASEGEREPRRVDAAVRTVDPQARGGGPGRVDDLVSRARAQSVYEALLTRGVDAKQLSVMGAGPDQPLAGKKGTFERNNRVELLFLLQ